MSEHRKLTTDELAELNRLSDLSIAKRPMTFDEYRRLAQLVTLASTVYHHTWIATHAQHEAYCAKVVQ